MLRSLCSIGSSAFETDIVPRSRAINEVIRLGLQSTSGVSAHLKDGRIFWEKKFLRMRDR